MQGGFRSWIGVGTLPDIAFLALAWADSISRRSATILAFREWIGAQRGSADPQAGETPQYFRGRTIAMRLRRAQRPAAERGSVQSDESVSA